jgi:Transposase DDE domain group 1
VIGKAEVLGDKDNPRFIVTNLSAEGFDDDQQAPDRFCAQKCYEDFYCARGNMENQIKQQYLDLDGDRTSTHWMASNQLRLWFSAFALFCSSRDCALWACRAPNWRRRLLARSGNDCSRLAPPGHNLLTTKAAIGPDK